MTNLPHDSLKICGVRLGYVEGFSYTYSKFTLRLPREIWSFREDVVAAVRAEMAVDVPTEMEAVLLETVLTEMVGVQREMALAETATLRGARDGEECTTEWEATDSRTSLLRRATVARTP